MEIDYQSIIKEVGTPLISPFGFVYDEERSEVSHGMYKFTRTEQGHLQEVLLYRRYYHTDELTELIYGISDLPAEVADSDGGYFWISNRYIGAELHHDKSSNALTKFGVGVYNLRSEIIDEPINFNSERVKTSVASAEWWEFTDDEGFRQAVQDILKMFRLFGINWFKDCIPQRAMKKAKLKKRIG